MKDERGYLHRQLGMQVSSLGKTGNNPYTYNCDGLYMASPLEKSRELAVLIITQNMACPVLCCGSCWTTSSYQGGCREGEDQKVWRVRNRREGIQIGLSLYSANRKKRQMVHHTVISLHELWRSGHGPSPQAFLSLSCDLIFGTEFC